MPAKKYRVFLSDKERKYLRKLVNTGTEKARKLTRARILLLTDESPSGLSNKDKEIMDSLGVCARTVAATRERFVEEGIEGALNEKPRSGRPREFTGREEAKLTLIACSEPPEGRDRWSVRLLADKLVEMEVVDSISRESVRKYLKKGISNRG
jgi:transposase